MRHLLLWCLAIAVMVSVTAEVSAGGRHGHGHGHDHRHGHGHGHHHDDGPYQVIVTPGGVHAGGSWWQAPSDCRIERRWGHNGDYRERIDCRQGTTHGLVPTIPTLQAPQFTIVIPID